MKKMVKKILVGLGIWVILVSLSGCGRSTNSKKGDEETLLETWQQVSKDFSKVVASISSDDEAIVELKVIELTKKGYPKKYEFIGLRNGKEFLRYDEDGTLKE